MAIENSMLVCWLGGRNRLMLTSQKDLLQELNSFDATKYCNMAIFNVDVGSAFVRTPMADIVKHKSLKLDKRED
jgi:hypothetical protein